MKYVLAIDHAKRTYFFRKDGVWSTSQSKARRYATGTDAVAELFNARRALGKHASKVVPYIKPIATKKVRENPRYATAKITDRKNRAMRARRAEILKARRALLRKSKGTPRYAKLKRAFAKADA
jgi:hypothetical protein